MVNLPMVSAHGKRSVSLPSTTSYFDLVVPSHLENVSRVFPGDKSSDLAISFLGFCQANNFTSEQIYFTKKLKVQHFLIEISKTA